jgi:hypothetical protein
MSFLSASLYSTSVILTQTFLPSNTTNNNLYLKQTPPTFSVSHPHTTARMSTAHGYYYPSPTLPIPMPHQKSYYPSPPHYSHVNASPPEAPESVTTSGVASFEPSATSSSYAGSASDYDSSHTTGVDLIEYMSDRMHGSLDPMPLDRSLVKQSQTYSSPSLSQFLSRSMVSAIEWKPHTQLSANWKESNTNALTDRVS